MSTRGDTERQAILRNSLVGKTDMLESDPFIIKIRAVLQPGMKLLDVGCGTAHIIGELALHHTRVLFAGLDISRAMLKIARQKTTALSHALLVEGDGLRLPFSDCAFDTVITRLADYSPAEAYRVLKKKGYFFEYGLGPEADKEIAEFFQERIDKDSFFQPHDSENWQEEVCRDVRDVGFFIEAINEYREDDYYQNKYTVMDLIEMVPLVKDFDRSKDSRIIDALASKYGATAGIKITWHYYILKARRL